MSSSEGNTDHLDPLNFCYKTQSRDSISSAASSSSRQHLSSLAPAPPLLPYQNRKSSSILPSTDSSISLPANISLPASIPIPWHNHRQRLGRILASDPLNPAPPLSPAHASLPTNFPAFTPAKDFVKAGDVPAIRPPVSPVLKRSSYSSSLFRATIERMADDKDAATPGFSSADDGTPLPDSPTYQSFADNSSPSPDYCHISGVRLNWSIGRGRCRAFSQHSAARSSSEPSFHCFDVLRRLCEAPV